MANTSSSPTGWQRATEQDEVQERIRRRAYELYEQRGREDGCDLGDWLRAESELTQNKAKAVGT